MIDQLIEMVVWKFMFYKSKIAMILGGALEQALVPNTVEPTPATQ